jgi:replication fork protection complex subunit Csm3/Swi3
MAPSAASPSDAPRDDFDALFDSDPGTMEELFKNTHGRTNTDGNNTRSPLREHSPAARRSEALGLDEEVKIAKKRQPVAKLDVTR